MIKCVPTISAINRTKISFHVSIVDTNISIDTIHTMYGGGEGYSGKKIGEASAILQNCSETWTCTDSSIEVLYLAGYRDDGKDFCVEVEREITTACIQAFKAIWE